MFVYTRTHSEGLLFTRTKPTWKQPACSSREDWMADYGTNVAPGGSALGRKEPDAEAASRAVPSTLRSRTDVTNA